MSIPNKFATDRNRHHRRHRLNNRSPDDRPELAYRRKADRLAVERFQVHSLPAARKPRKRLPC